MVMDFWLICSGAMLFRLSNSANDVPDAAAFQADLDHIRTAAKQEDSEYEQRAVTIRGRWTYRCPFLCQVDKRTRRDKGTGFSGHGTDWGKRICSVGQFSKTHMNRLLDMSYFPKITSNQGNTNDSEIYTTHPSLLTKERQLKRYRSHPLLFGILESLCISSKPASSDPHWEPSGAELAASQAINLDLPTPASLSSVVTGPLRPTLDVSSS